MKLSRELYGWDSKNDGDASTVKATGPGEGRSVEGYKNQGRGRSSFRQRGSQGSYSEQFLNRNRPNTGGGSERVNHNNGGNKRFRSQTTAGTNKRQQSRQGNQGFGNQIAPCSKCGRAHPGECRKGSRQCFNCGKEGHYIKDCPGVLKLGAPGENKPKPNARVYSLNEGEVETGPSTTVTGQLSVANLSAYSLIDSGASHSFIAAHTSNKLEWKKEVFTQPFYTVTPAGDLYKSTSWFRNVPI